MGKHWPEKPASQGSSPCTPTPLRGSSVVEQGATNPKVAGPNPARGAIKVIDCYFFHWGVVDRKDTRQRTGR